MDVTILRVLCSAFFIHAFHCFEQQVIVCSVSHTPRATRYQVNSTDASREYYWEKTGNRTVAHHYDNVSNKDDSVLIFNATHLLNELCEPIIDLHAWTDKGHKVHVRCFANCSGTPGVEPEAGPGSENPPQPAGRGRWGLYCSFALLLVPVPVLVLVDRRKLCFNEEEMEDEMNERDPEAARG